MLSLCMVIPTAGDVLTITPGSSWTASDGVYSTRYDGKKDSGISANADVAPDTFYTVTWKMRSSEAELRSLFIVLATVGDFGSCAVGYPVSEAWNEYTFSFYSGTTSAVPLRWYNNPSSAKTVEIKDASIQKIPPERFRDNVMPDGYFHTSSVIPVNWNRDDGAPVLPAAIVSVSDFLAGRQCMLLKLEPQEKASTGMCSAFIPMIPGKTFQASFWAKADRELQISFDVNGWPMFKHSGKHWYKSKTVKVTPEWNRYELTVDIPADFTAYPDLQARMVRIRFQNKYNTQTGAVHIAAVTFRQV